MHNYAVLLSSFLGLSTFLQCTAFCVCKLISSYSYFIFRNNELTYLYSVILLEVTSPEFQKDLWREKTKAKTLDYRTVLIVR